MPAPAKVIVLAINVNAPPPVLILIPPADISIVAVPFCAFQFKLYAKPVGVDTLKLFASTKLPLKFRFNVALTFEPFTSAALLVMLPPKEIIP